MEQLVWIPSTPTLASVLQALTAQIVRSTSTTVQTLHVKMEAPVLMESIDSLASVRLASQEFSVKTSSTNATHLLVCLEEHVSTS